MKNLKWILLLIFFQGAVVSFVFKNIIARPDKYVFVNEYDGIKNYFTLFTYATDTTNNNYTHFRMMNFPYGDVVVFTDNTPAFAIPYKFITSRYSEHGNRVITVFNLFILFNIILCSVICFLILRKLVSLPAIAFAIALALPWINPMFFRLRNHLNLSLSSIVVFWLWLLLVMYDARANKRKFILLSFLLSATIALSFFIHPYYVFIGGFMSGFFLLAAGCAKLNARLLAGAFTVPGVALLAAKIFLLLLDPFATERGNEVIGYGFDDWEVTLTSMFTSNPFNTIRFFVAENFNLIHYETRTYVGAAVILALIFILFVALFYPEGRMQLHNIIQTKKGLLSVLLFTALLMVMLSFGEDFYILGTKHHFYNFLNPIYVLRKAFLPELAHIRYVARFCFPVVFILYFILAWFIGALLKSELLLFKTAACILLLAVAVDFSDAVADAPRGVQNPFSLSGLKEIEGAAVPAQDCAAILPVPYYYAGSEDTKTTVETDEVFFNYTLQLSAHTGLPLMSCKMSRTPEYQNHAQLELFLNGKPSAEISTLLKGKNILMVYNKRLNEQSTLPAANNEVTEKVLQNGITLPQKLGAKKISETDNLVFYKWTVN